MTLVDASHTPDQPTSQARVSEAGSAKIPFKARVSLFRQRIILTVRWWFRLPIDAIKEEETQAQIDALVALHQKQMETVQTLVRVANNMQRRLQHYEKHVPRIRDLKQQLDRELVRELSQETSPDNELQQALDNGILRFPSSNGDRKPLIIPHS